MVHEQQPSANDTCWSHKSTCGMECCIILHKILLRIKICSGQCPQLSTLPYHGTSIGEVHSGHAELLESAWCLVQWGYTLDTLSYWVVRLEFPLLQVWQITFALQQHASIISFLLQLELQASLLLLSNYSTRATQSAMESPCFSLHYCWRYPCRPATHS